VSRTKRRVKATPQEKKLGVQGTTHAFDYFTNAAARMGFGTPNLAEDAEYELIRFSYDYWRLLTLYRNHWISRRIVDMPAMDMVRSWPKLTSDIEPEDITRIDKALRRTNSKGNLLTALKWARLFGGAGCLIVIKGQEDQLDQPLDLDDIELNSYKGLIPFDRWAGISPSGEVCNDIMRPVDFNKPEMYSVRNEGGESFSVHASRILRFLGPEVPTPEREAQSWWGISALEPVYEEIRKRDNMSWNILSLTFRAQILGMKFPELAQLLSGLGSSQEASQGFEQRMSAINHLLSNQSLVPLPKDGSIESTQYSFTGLSECYQQFQLDISGAAQIPVTRLWGRTITGLGQSNDADERIYEERIAGDQDTDLRPQLEKLYPILCMSELGEVPEDLDLVFPSVRVLDEKEKSELAKTLVDTVTVALNSGGISPQVYAKELKQGSDLTGIFTNITDEDIAKLPDTVQQEGDMGEGLFGEEEGEPQLSPAGSPQKVLREEGKAKAADTAPLDAKPGDRIRVNGKLLTVRKVTRAENLLGEPEVHIAFTTGEVVPYRLDGDINVSRAQDADGPSNGTRRLHGLDIVIETPKGYQRHGKDWTTTMPADYGYIKGVAGADGDSLDVYVGPESNGWAYVIDQAVLGGKKFDEHKVLLGFPSAQAALDAYKAGHHRSADVFMDWTPMRADEFVEWTKTHDMKNPCSSEVR
jgi:phage-related protein (TIGR01555 family)